MIKVKAEPDFKQLYHLPPNVNLVIMIGGRGGMKTYEASKFAAYSATIKKMRCVILRDEKELIRESILNEVLLRYDKANENGILSQFYDRLDTGIKDRETNEMLVFTKGFRASQGDKKANLKSISNVDIAIIEEAEDIRDEDKFNTFADSIRKKGSVIILILNTPDINHWIIKRYFEVLPVLEDGKPIDGFFNIVPKKIPGFLCIQTDFEKNPYLPDHIKDRYRAYGDPKSHLYNPFYYYSAIKGYASLGRKGQVFTKYKYISLEDYLKLPFKEVYGLDFGTSSPAGIVGCKIHRNTLYARQLNYKPLETLQIGKFFCEKKFKPDDLIVADSADPKSIDKLSKGYQRDELDPADIKKYPELLRGFYVKPARKGPDSVKYGIDTINSMEFFVVDESEDLKTELQNYIYAVDKNKNPTNDPIDEFNHLIDPIRYVVDRVKGRHNSSAKEV